MKGLTFSLDPVVFDDTCTDKFRVTKSKNALNEITQIKHKYRNCDVVAEVTVDKQNCQYLEKLLKYLSEHNVYSDLTFIELQKSKWYDFSAVTNSDLIIEKNSNEYMMLKDLISRFNKEGYLVHFKEVFENALEFTNMKWTCNLKNNLLNNITIEPDGSLRLCLRIKGEFKNENFFKNVINGSINRKEIEEFKREMTKEYERKCLGCNWTCMMMGEMNNGNYKKITEHE